MPTRALAYAIFFASGFAALLYQVIWQRMLALFSGADVFSVTLIVSAFMGGLGLGNLAGGHLADRRSRAACLALFALAEAAIGGFALLSRTFYYDVLYARVGALDLGVPALAAVLFVSVLWPTFFMGISLPLLARGLTPSLEHAARTVARLYGWNTLGAAVGAGVATWILLRRFDLGTCLRIGAIANLACAAGALPLRASIGRAAPAVAPAAERATETNAAEGSRLGLPAWLLVYALSGAIALALEIVWFRVLGVVLKSTSFTFGTLLAIYLVGTASGSLLGARLVERSTRMPAAYFFALQTFASLWAFAGILALLAVASTGASGALSAHLATTDHTTFTRGLAAFGAGGIAVLLRATEDGAAARLFLGVQALLPFLLVYPATLMMGMSFPFLQRVIQTDAARLGRRVGWLQTANIVGSLVGSIVTGFWLLPELHMCGTLRVLSGLALAFPILALVALPRRDLLTSFVPWFGLGALLSATVAFPISQEFWGRLHGAERGDFGADEDAAGVSGILRIAERPGIFFVTAGGVEVSSIPFGGYEGIHTLLGVLPVLLHPLPLRVAVIGIGSGDTAYAAAARPVTSELVAIEILGSQLAVLRTNDRNHHDPGLDAFLNDPRIRMVVGDGRTVIRRGPADWDVIEADALRPTSAYSGNLYSLEYFALLRERLAPGGYAVSWLPTPRVAATFARSFPHVLVLGNVGIGAEGPIPFDRDAIRARLRDPRLAQHFQTAGIDIAARVEAFLDGVEPRVLGPGSDRSALTDVNSDLFAKDEFLFDGAPPTASAPR